MPYRTTWYILAPTFAVSSLLLLVGLAGALYIHRTNQQVSDSLDRNLASAQEAERMVLELRDIRLKLDHFVDSGERSHLQAAIAAMEEVRRSSAARSFAQLSDNLDDLYFLMVPWNMASGDQPSRRDVSDWITMLNERLLDPVEHDLDARQISARDTSRRNLEVARRIGVALFLLGVCGAAAGLLIGFGIARGVHRSLVEISVPVRDIAGRLNEVVGPITVSSDADLSGLDSALRVLADKTGDVVQRLQTSQYQTLRSEQLAAVGQLAAGLAHELRNPLMSIKLILQTAAERTKETLKPRELAVVEGEVTRLERMLQTFLDFARPPQPEKQAVDIDELLRQAIDIMEARAAQQDVRFHYTPPARPLYADVDAAQMQQVLMNLMINALDAIPGGGNIWLEASSIARPADTPVPRSASKPKEAWAAWRGEHSRQEIASEWVVISVADDGPGVSPDVAERIFEPFVSTKMTGIGLGLSISRRIVESHNGQISVQNRRSGGAEFTIQVPAAISAALRPAVRDAR